jgi:hypothetical protein
MSVGQMFLAKRCGAIAFCPAMQLTLNAAAINLTKNRRMQSPKFHQNANFDFNGTFTQA